MSAFWRFLKLSVQEDYRMPIAEVFAFLMALAPLTLYASGVNYAVLKGSAAFSFLSSALGLAGFLFLILILKNVSFGIGADLEKGITNTFLTFPMSRAKYLAAKLVSGALIPFVMFMVAPLPVALAFAPHFSDWGVLLLYWGVEASGMMVIIGLMVLVALATKKGSTSLIAGLALYFGSEFANAFAIFYAERGNADLFYALSVLNPLELWTAHYSRMFRSFSISVSATTAAALTATSAALGVALLIIAFMTFDRVIDL
ncbi:MAG: hypothetical protein ACP5T5_01135 [Thermoprotei archaeon]|nr:hypothetical protein [TACK group archaeon]